MFQVVQNEPMSLVTMLLVNGPFIAATFSLTRLEKGTCASSHSLSFIPVLH